MDNTLGARSWPRRLTSRCSISRLTFLPLLAAGAIVALPAHTSADPLPLGATSGVISVRFDDNVTGGVIPGQCVVVQPGGQVCDNGAEDEDANSGEISVTQPFGSYVVGYDPVNQPADRLIKAPSAVACELIAQSPLCDVLYSFNPAFIGPPSYPIPVNLFLTAQDGNAAPPSCAAATDVATFTHTLPSPPTTPVGGFEMELSFDPALVCVRIEAGAYFRETPGSVCFVADMGPPAGVERLGCVVSGDPETTSTSLEMAVVRVRAQPSQYLSILASQDNGVNALVLNQSCNLADLNGQPIPMLGCDDYDVTIRRLEADVNGDCAVDVRDQQLLAYRLGRPPIGPFGDRFDLEPPGGNGKIDIHDLQFVTGRHGSTCEVPIPPQPPRSSYLD